MADLPESTQEIIKKFGKNEHDTGATEVQCALITSRILSLTEYVKTRHKDVAAKRALLKLVAQRKRFLIYLAKQNQGRYRDLIGALGLRK
jgi:small subunit ribosomal protein S15